MCLGELAVVTAVTDTTVPGHVLVEVPARGIQSAVALIDDLCPGDHVLVHAGHVLSKLTADQAATAATVRPSSLP
jgi:hydrogenase maturation factor